MSSACIVILSSRGSVKVAVECIANNSGCVRLSSSAKAYNSSCEYPGRRSFSDRGLSVAMVPVIAVG